MKLEKKHYTMIVVGAVVLFLIYWFLLRKKKPESSYDPNVMIFGDSNYDGVYGSDGTESGYSKTKGKGKNADSFTMVVPEGVGNSDTGSTAKCNPAPQQPGCWNCGNAGIYYGWCPGKGVTGWGLKS